MRFEFFAKNILFQAKRKDIIVIRYRTRILKNISQKVMFFFILVFFLAVPDVYTSTDIMIFSPHPGDEVLCCGRTIIKGIQNNKNVKVVFLTNGDANKKAASLLVNKSIEDLGFEDYIYLGTQHQKEALSAIYALGLKEKDAVFLSYPERGILPLLNRNYNTYIMDQRKGFFSGYKSLSTGSKFSPYIKTFNRAEKGYTFCNLIDDIKELLIKFKPQNIYIPYPYIAPKYPNLSQELSGIYDDHLASSHFVVLAVNELMLDNRLDWVYSPKVFYYFINDFDNKKIIIDSPLKFVQKPLHKEDIKENQINKMEILNLYESYSQVFQKNGFLDLLGMKEELFWDSAYEKKLYLKELENEWAEIAGIMKQYGYNVNFAPVADVVGNKNRNNNRLAKSERSYSEDSSVVLELSLAAITGMLKNGIIPVIKHFPGLGGSSWDTHDWLPKIKISKEEFYNKKFLPFKELVKKRGDIWVMINHVVYPFWDEEPASLSYKIQTDILRKELGFKGIIITDELSIMEAIKYYARKNNIKEPYIGEIVLRAFNAGSDMAVIYTKAKETEKYIGFVNKTLKQAIQEGKITEKDIDISVKRILKYKEKLFKKPLLYLLKDMSFEEKICQKLIMDTSSETELFKRYNLGGLHVRNARFIKEIQINAKIPFFIIGMHEGGVVNDPALKIFSKSSYSIGKEYELLINRNKKQIPFSFQKDKGYNPQDKKNSVMDYTQLSEGDFKDIKKSLMKSLEDLIVLWSDIKQKGYSNPHPNDISPLFVDDTPKFVIRPFHDVSTKWLKKFSNEKKAKCAYNSYIKVFKSLRFDFQPLDTIENIIANLESFKTEIDKIEIKNDKSEIRVLCLAAHPDDEDGQALVYFKKLLNCSTDILLATRGQGGENLIGSGLDKELGFIRTEEMEKASAILGVDQVYYLGKKDFGYCLDFDEALEEWGREDTLKKIVYFYRLIKPHIIITKHNNNEGHCQHKAFAFLAEKAFDLSGNPKIYPKMLKQGLPPWQPEKFYQRVLTNNDNTGIALDTSEIIPLENKSINQIAYDSLAEHRSQIYENNENRDEKVNQIFYKLVKSKVTPDNKKTDYFFDGIFPRDSFEKEGTSTFSGMPGVKIVKSLKIGLFEKNKNTLFITLKTLGCDFKIMDEKLITSALPPLFAKMPV